MNLVIDRNHRLYSEDALHQTFGCRHTNPIICKRNNLIEVCAFVRKDKICVEPPNSWKEQYKKLEEGKK